MAGCHSLRLTHLLMFRSAEQIQALLLGGPKDRHYCHRHYWMRTCEKPVKNLLIIL